MKRKGTPIGVIVWHAIHSVINRLAWRYGLDPGWRQGDWGSGVHIRRDHWLWRLNGWAASHWTTWWMSEMDERYR